MKVDIITRHAVANYGSILQTYATQKVLSKEGIENQVINYIREDERGKNIAKTMLKRNEKWNSNIIRRMIYKIFQTHSYTKSFNIFSKFRREILNETSITYNSLEDLKNDKPIADLYMTGSDQVWGKIGDDEYDRSYFLDFLEKGDRCISYASSFGKNEISKDLEDNLNNLLEKYETIFVREENAKKILEEKNINSEVTLDPTLLLTSDDWDKFISDENIGKYNDMIVVYQLHNNNEILKIALELSRKIKKKILVISANAQKKIGKYKYLYLPKPSLFLYCIKHASYVITDSFHATVFSIIFNKKFSVILPSGTSTRITGLLEKYNLKSRIYSNIDNIENSIDYNEINSKLEADRNDSIEKLKNAINKKLHNIDCINKKMQCCGCSACYNACPSNAISMIINDEGFYEPKIDYSKCINCGLCHNLCPQLNNKIKFAFPIKTYAAYINDKKNILNSSSGGLFYQIAKKIIESYGIVYGVAWNQNMESNHVKVDSLENLNKLQGSKYVQSNLKQIFLDIMDDLNNNKIVLFSGTPCQIAGLKSFLKKDYINLITIDLVCHGVPSPLLFNKYKEWYEYKNNVKIIDYSFRDKYNNDWGVNARIKVLKNKKNKYLFVRAKLDPYFKAFTDGSNYRECCYDCKYAKKDRISDITLADYWGIENVHKNFINKKGVSLLIINTERGVSLFNNIINNIKYIESDINEAVKYNLNLNKPSVRPDLRNYVYSGLKDINSSNFYDYSKNNLNFRIDVKEIIKQVMPYKLKKILKNLLNKM